MHAKNTITKRKISTDEVAITNGLSEYNTKVCEPLAGHRRYYHVTVHSLDLPQQSLVSFPCSAPVPPHCACACSNSILVRVVGLTRVYSSWIYTWAIVVHVMRDPCCGVIPTIIKLAITKYQPSGRSRKKSCKFNIIKQSEMYILLYKIRMANTTMH